MLLSGQDHLDRLTSSDQFKLIRPFLDLPDQTTADPGNFLFSFSFFISQFAFIFTFGLNCTFCYFLIFEVCFLWKLKGRRWGEQSDGQFQASWSMVWRIELRSSGHMHEFHTKCVLICICIFFFSFFWKLPSFLINCYMYRLSPLPMSNPSFKVQTLFLFSVFFFFNQFHWSPHNFLLLLSSCPNLEKAFQY